MPASTSSKPSRVFLRRPICARPACPPSASAARGSPTAAGWRSTTRPATRRRARCCCGWARATSSAPSGGWSVCGLAPTSSRRSSPGPTTWARATCRPARCAGKSIAVITPAPPRSFPSGARPAGESLPGWCSGGSGNGGCFWGALIRAAYLGGDPEHQEAGG